MHSLHPNTFLFKLYLLCLGVQYNIYRLLALELKLERLYALELALASELNLERFYTLELELKLTLKLSFADRFTSGSLSLLTTHYFLFMTIGIDAAGTRRGGSLVYLKVLLEEFNPEKFKEIDKIIVWGAASALDKIKTTAPVEKVSFPILEKQNIFLLLLWKLYLIYFLAPRKCGLLYVPGGIIFKSRQKKVIMLHNLLPFDYKIRSLYKRSAQYFKLRLLERLYKMSLRYADKVIFPAQFTKEAIEKITGTVSNSKVIHHGLGKSFLNYKPAQKQKAPGSPFKLLYVSDITRYKRQVELVKAVSRLANVNFNITLTLAGTLPEYHKKIFFDELNKANSNGVKVFYLGYIKYEDLPALYDEHDILLFPSLTESFGLPIIEASYMNLYLLFTFKGLTELMHLAGYNRYSLLQGDLYDSLKSFLEKVDRSEINLNRQNENYNFTEIKEASHRTFDLLTQ